MADQTPTPHPDAPVSRGVIVTVFNQKGGIGKTTTSVNLAVCLAAGGWRVALVDVDSQSNATTSLGLVGSLSKGAYHLMTGHATLAEASQDTAFPGLIVCRADDDLAGIELELALEPEPHTMLRHSLHNGPLPVDIVIIDCPPALGMVPVNALAASDFVLVPVSPEPLARDGLHRAWRHIQRVRARLNPRLEIAGVLVSMIRDTKVHESLAEMLKQELGGRILPVEIPFDSKVVAASHQDLPVAVFDPACPATRAYLALAALIGGAVQRRGARIKPGSTEVTPFDLDQARANLGLWQARLVSATARTPSVPEAAIPSGGWVGAGDAPRPPAPTAAPSARPVINRRLLAQPPSPPPPPSRRGLAAGLGAAVGAVAGGLLALIGHGAGWLP